MPLSNTHTHTVEREKEQRAPPTPGRFVNRGPDTVRQVLIDTRQGEARTLEHDKR